MKPGTSVALPRSTMRASDWNHRVLADRDDAFAPDDNDTRLTELAVAAVEQTRGLEHGRRCGRHNIARFGVRHECDQQAC
jgi:hypothetical protein